MYPYFYCSGEKTINFCNCLSGRQAGRESIGFSRRSEPSQKKRATSLRPRPSSFPCPLWGKGVAERRIGGSGRGGRSVLSPARPRPLSGLRPSFPQWGQEKTYTGVRGRGSAASEMPNALPFGVTKRRTVAISESRETVTNFFTNERVYKSLE